MDRGHKSDAAAMGTPRHANLTTYLHSPSIARGKVGLGWFKVISFWQWLTPELVGHEIRILQDTLMLPSPRAIGVSSRKQFQPDGSSEFFHLWNCWNGTANIVCLRLAQFNLPGDYNRREPEMDWMGRMGSITLHGQFSLSGSRLLPSPGRSIIFNFSQLLVCFSNLFRLLPGQANCYDSFDDFAWY